MKIEDVYWTPKVNMLLIRCECGHLFEHSANKRIAICSGCGKKEDTLIMKGIKRGE